MRCRVGGSAPPALADVSFAVEPGRVCGLFGREGAGKSTLLGCLAAYRRPSAGTVRVDGDDPFENARLMSGICLVDGRGGIGVDESTTVREVLEIVALLRPRWDQAFADTLLDRFEVAAGAKVGQLARGRRAALAVTIALATRAPLTMLDEAHLDLEPAHQATFQRELRAEQAAHPRTIILAGATVGEGGDEDADGLDDTAGGLLDDVVLLGRGRVLATARAAELRGLGRELTGEADAVAALVHSLSGDHVLSGGAAVDGGAVGDALVGAAVSGQAVAVVADRRLGRLRSVVLAGPVPPDALGAADRAGISVSPVGLRRLVTCLTDDRLRSGEHRERTP
ncbi:hypothetical protein BL253_26550 [Pseudofrankia asymbiotica]|uniref:ABC transporter domain-containing protein n=1 Tax=Pseudofrankia asymbiotica TaxID=1834516 RepID=A0A1V2I4K2_9ACTN|nr:hypothetical protein BL253_26550 [Pseudofrankia asymbiotica]